MTDCECGDSFINEFENDIWILHCYACGLKRPMTEKELTKYGEDWYSPYESDVDGEKK